MQKFKLILWLYAKAVLATAIIMSLLFIPAAGMYFPMVFVISLVVAVICFIPLCMLLSITMGPVFRLNYSFSSCLVFFGFVNAAIGAGIINALFYLVVRTWDEQLLIANTACIIMAWSGCYLSRNSLRKFYQESQLLNNSSIDAQLLDQDQGENETNRNGSEFDPYTISLN